MVRTNTFYEINGFWQLTDLLWLFLYLGGLEQCNGKSLTQKSAYYIYTLYAFGEEEHGGIWQQVKLLVSPIYLIPQSKMAL